MKKVYPFSIMEGFQQGEVYVDNKDNPSVALIWHYCGFAHIVGKEHACMFDERRMSIMNLRFMI